VKDLAGKVAFITGGASGVGLGQAKVFAEEARMKIAIADVHAERLASAADYFRAKGLEVHPILLDIMDRSAYARAADDVERQLGPVQLLMNTAGVSERVAIEQATYEDWDWHIGVNLNGVINGIQTFVPRMLKLGQECHIVNTASTSAFFPAATVALYATTKFALRGLSEAMRLDLVKYGIGVSCLCVGAVNTNILESGALRPAEFRPSVSRLPDTEAVAVLKGYLEAGFDPVDLGRIVLEGVKRNELWIFPHPEYISKLEAKTRELVDAMGQWSTHPAVAPRLGASK
jgi:NAD(P)-dependent dehydrogenase (short-subunit alcohol dehydrogenase family)